MLKKITGALFGLALLCGACFGQAPMHGLVAGQSTRADVERVVGKPVAVYGETLVEYHAHEFDPKTWDKNVAKVYVQYRKDSPIAERIEALLIQPISRSDAFKNIALSSNGAHLPDQPTARGKLGDHLVEYFGAPYYVVLTFQGADEKSGVARSARYSKELFDSAVSSPNSNASSNAPSNAGSSTALIPSATNFTVKLLSPLNTVTSKKGDKVAAQVLEPQSFYGDILEGAVHQAKSGGKINGKSVLNFSFDRLNHGGQAFPVQATVKSVTNSKGQLNVDEEGQIVKKKNNLGKIAAGTAVGALIGGLAGGGKGAAIGAGVGAGASLVLVEVAAEGANVSFAPGSEFVLSVKSQNR